jgi:hypothetical protein
MRQPTIFVEFRKPKAHGGERVSGTLLSLALTTGPRFRGDDVDFQGEQGYQVPFPVTA